jgi:hypothetical protein
LRRKAERIREFLKGNGERIGRTGKEIKSNVTDNESANIIVPCPPLSKILLSPYITPGNKGKKKG